MEGGETCGGGVEGGERRRGKAPLARTHTNTSTKTKSKVKMCGGERVRMAVIKRGKDCKEERYGIAPRYALEAQDDGDDKGRHARSSGLSHEGVDQLGTAAQLRQQPPHPTQPHPTRPSSPAVQEQQVAPPQLPASLYRHHHSCLHPCIASASVVPTHTFVFLTLQALTFLSSSLSSASFPRPLSSLRACVRACVRLAGVYEFPARVRGRHQALDRTSLAQSHPANPTSPPLNPKHLQAPCYLVSKAFDWKCTHWQLFNRLLQACEGK